MPHRHPHLPKQWLMTDERVGEALWDALAALPRGGGVVFRHYGLAESERRALFRRVAHIARRRRLIVLRAGGRPLGRGESGVHNGPRPVHGLWSRSVHDAGELARARRDRVDLIFISPIFATRSHPGAPVLGINRAIRLATRSPIPAIALGGMTPARARRLGNGFHGWAAIDWWSNQKRKAVPI